jgi:hypothetical protein
MKKAAIIFLSIPLLGLLLMLNWPKHDFLFIFPNNTEGVFRVQADPVNGQDMPVVNGFYVIHVPLSGRVVLKSLKPFSEWHKYTGQYQNGDFVPNESLEYKNEIKFYSLPTVGDNGHDYLADYYYLGTASDYEKISHTFDITKLPLGLKPIEQPKASGQ